MATKIEERVNRKYSSETHRQQVLAEIERAGTADKILAGELTLPDWRDVDNHITRGHLARVETQIRDHGKDAVIKALLQQLDANKVDALDEPEDE